MRVGFYAKALCTGVAISALPSAPVAQVQINQNFVEQGPAPSSGQYVVVGSGDAAGGSQGTVGGDIQTILLDPLLGPDTIFVGSPNGGIFKSTDGGSTWEPKTDDAVSLSTSSLALDPTDQTGNTLIAGVGVTSSGNWDYFNRLDGAGGGGRRTGVLYSNDGGESWTPFGGPALSGQSVVGVAASGDTLMAATFEQDDVTKTKAPGNRPYGLYLSQDGGESFDLVPQCGQACNGLPAGPVSSLVADSSDPTHQTFYAAVTSPDTPTDAGVYVTDDAGVTWSPVFTEDTVPTSGTNVITDTNTQVVLRLSTAPDGSVAIAALGGPDIDDSEAELTGLYLSNDNGQTWSGAPDNNLPPTNIVSAAIDKMAVTIDPNDTSKVYVAGDEIDAGPFPAPVFRVDFADGGTFESLNCQQFNDGSCIPGTQPVGITHADARAMAVDPVTGDLYLVGDGGVYKRTNPLSDDGTWSGLNVTLGAREPYQVAYGAYANRLAVAAQDAGVALQNDPNSPLYKAIQPADGGAALVRDVNDATFADKPVSVYYTATETFCSLTRLVVDKDGNALNPQGKTNDASCGGVPEPNPAGIQISFNGTSWIEATGSAVNFNVNPNIVLNKVDGYQNLIAIAGTPNVDQSCVNNAPNLCNHVFVTEDNAPVDAEFIDLTLTDVGPANAFGATTLAYGTRDNPHVLLASGPTEFAATGALYLSTNAQPGVAAAPIAPLPAYSGAVPTSLVFDQNAQDRFYVADTFKLWGTGDQGTSFFEIDTPDDMIRPTSVEFISNNGVDALLLGGLMECTGSCAETQSPIAVANSDNGALQDFQTFGSGLPNVLVYQMQYNPVADVLSVAGVGRGAWSLYDVTSYFEQAHVLQFGIAGNDSLPDASYLTDGTRLDGTSFLRPLAKYGGGGLAIEGDATYTGGTTIFDGALQLGTGGESGSILGDVAFCSDTIDPLNGLKVCDPSIDKFLIFDRSDTYSFGGAIDGPGQLVQNGTGITILTADSTYTGPTWVSQGALIVNGSIVSPVGVNSGALLGGSGAVGATTIAGGGVLAPGNSIDTMTVNGDLTLNSGAFYLVEANANGASDMVVVNGMVSLTGATLAVLAEPGAYAPETEYVIIDNDGTDAVNGEFAEVNDNLVFLDPTVEYDAGNGNDVVLTLTRNATLFQDVARTKNQRAVAGALDQFPTDNALFLTLLTQTADSAREAFDALSGEIHGTVAGTLADDSRYVREAVLGRLMQANHADDDPLGVNGPKVTALNADVASLYGGKSLLDVPPESAPLAFWTQGFGAWADYDTDGNAASADRDLGGFISGMDADVGEGWRAGLATGATFSSVDVNARASSADVETYHLGGYVGGMVGGFALRGGGLYAWNSVDTSRAVIFPGFFERQNASYDADTGQLFGEIAYPTQMGGIALEPFGGLAFVSVDTDNFRERGGALTSLRGEADQDLGYSTLGLRAATTMQWGNTQVTPHISAAWQHAFDDVTPGASFAFATSGIGFAIAGAPLAEDSALIDAGLDFALGPNGTAGVSYSGQYGGGVTDTAVKGHVTWLF